MSGYVRPALISAIADSIGISDVSGEVARVLAPDVEYRVRDILQEARKFSRHGCRRRLECLDINHALQARDMEQLYGLNPDDRRRYSKIAGASDAFQIEDTLHRCQDMIHAPLPRPPLEVGVSMHWFLVKGIKPRIPENAVPSELVKWHQDKIMEANAMEITPAAVATAAPADPVMSETNTLNGAPGATTAATSGTGTAVIAALDKSGTPAVLMPIVKHSITEELCELLRICTEVLLAPTAEVGAEHPVFATLSADAGLDAAVPYIVAMIARGARETPHDLPRMWRLLWAAHALIRNYTNNAAAYLSQLLPALLTMLLNNSLGPGGGYDHYRLRRQAAVVLGDIAERYHQPDLNIRARIAATCMKALRKRPVRLCTSYGALQGLQALGGRTLRLLLLPEVGDVHNALLPCLTNVAVDRRSALRLAEAQHCLSALRDGACAACRQGATEVVSAGLSAAVMSQISSLDPDMSRHGSRISSEARKATASAIDQRIKELESQAKKAMEEGRLIQEQRIQQAQALQRVEAAAKATLENGDPSRTPQRPSADGVGPPADPVDPAAAARAAARIAAESFDPARAGGTSLVETTSAPNAAAQNGEAGIEVEGMDSPPGSPMFVPPPPKSPVTAPASNTGLPAAPQHPPTTQAKALQLDAQAKPLIQPPQAGSKLPQHAANQQIKEESDMTVANLQQGAAEMGSLQPSNGVHNSSAHVVVERNGPAAEVATASGQARTQNGNMGLMQPAGQEIVIHGSQDANSHQQPNVGNCMPAELKTGHSTANQTTSPRTAATTNRNGDVSKAQPVQGSGREPKCSLNPDTVQQGATPRMQKALKEGHNLGAHVYVVCELYGEAVLPWLGLDRVGGVFL